MKTRKIDQTSKHNTELEQLRAMDLIPQEGDPWTQFENDGLLEGFLDGWKYQGAIPSFQNSLGRSWKSIEAQLWKLCIRYPRPGIRAYEPTKIRTDRTGQPFNKRDLAIIELATSPTGRENDAHLHWNLAKILGRNPYEVERWMRQAFTEAPGLIKDCQPKEKEDCCIARIIHDTIKGAFAYTVTQIQL